MTDPRPTWMRDLLKAKAGWAPKIERSAGLKIRFGADDVLGCGHYGCVFPTSDPAWVVKISRDPTEGPMQAMILKWQAAGAYLMSDAFALVRGVWQIGPDITWRRKKWPVFAILREEVKPWLSIDDSNLKYGWSKHDLNNTNVDWIEHKPTYAMVERALSAMGQYRVAASEWHRINDLKWRKGWEETKERALGQVEDRLIAYSNTISDSFPEVGGAIEYIRGEGMLGAPLRDVHLGNVGIRQHSGLLNEEDPDYGPGMFVIYDPGHTPTPESTEKPVIAHINSRDQ